MNSRTFTLSVVLSLLTAGCGHYGVSGPDDLGLAARFQTEKIPIAIDDASLPPFKGDSGALKERRNRILSSWIIRSDFLCADYQLQLSRAIRDSRLTTDAFATVLSGLATIFAKPAVIHPLSGAATIALGLGGDIQSDLFLQQASDVMVTAMQSVRSRERTKIQEKLTAAYSDYTVEQGLVDIQRYDRETCNLNVALNEIRATLNIAGPVAPTANNPVIPLKPSPPTGEAIVGETTSTAAVAPTATTVIPPTVQPTAGGGIVITPGAVETTKLIGASPASAGSSVSTLTPDEQAAITRAGGFVKVVALLGLDTEEVKSANQAFRNRIKLIQTCQGGNFAPTGLIDQKLLNTLKKAPPNATRRIPGC